MNNVQTATRMAVLLRCARQHFWAHEVGLRKVESTLALKVGSAWARAMEARWLGEPYESALLYAMPEGIDIDAYTAESVAALLAAYYEYWGEREDMAKIHPEVQFRSALETVKCGLNAGPDGEPIELVTWTSEGKIDGLGTMKDGRSCKVEHKTTRESIAPDSDFWLRLAFNMQVWQYVTEARNLGWDLSVVFYDVVRKPAKRPCVIAILDAEGKKIVHDATGQRVYLKAGKNKGEPRQSGDKAKGYVLQERIETPAEFSERLYQDIKSRPEFYFQRREVPILDDAIEAFKRQRFALKELIEHYRSRELTLDDSEGFERDPEAWPRNVSTDTCKFCSYNSFCLQNISIDLANPPAGFEMKQFNLELDKYEHDAIDESSQEATDTATSS